MVKRSASRLRKAILFGAAALSATAVGYAVKPPTNTMAFAQCYDPDPGSRMCDCNDEDEKKCRHYENVIYDSDDDSAICNFKATSECSDGDACFFTNGCRAGTPGPWWSDNGGGSGNGSGNGNGSGSGSG